MIKAGFNPSRISSRQFSPGEVRQFNGCEIRRSLRWSRSLDAFMGVQVILVVKKVVNASEAAEEAERRHRLIARLTRSVCLAWEKQHPFSTNPSVLSYMYKNYRDYAEAIGFRVLDRIEKRKKWIKEISRE